MQLHNHYTEIQDAGGEVLIVTPLDGIPLERFVTEMNLPFPVLTDPQMFVYRTYGLERGLVLRPSSVSKFLRLLWKEGRFYFPLSDPLQTGGDFIIDGTGEIRFLYTSSDPLDRPQVQALILKLTELKT